MNIDEHKKIAGQRICYLRERDGYNKKELAEKIGMKSYTSVTKWENGNNLPRGLELVKLSELFDVSVDYLLGLSDVIKE